MLFSIVTITYNASRTLQRTLDSVACQTHRPIQHLIIDGASQDATVSIAEAYKQRVGDTKASSGYEVVVLSEPDKGLYDAMNKGLKMATGDYVLFLNAGDALHDATLSYLKRFTYAVLKPGETLAIEPDYMKLTDNRFGFGKKLIWDNTKK